jgi:hypothetical protein
LLEAHSQLIEERSGARRFEDEAGRQLHEDHTETRTQTRDFLGEALERCLAFEQCALVRDLPRNLYGKAEMVRHAVRPALVRLSLVRSVER